MVALRIKVGPLVSSTKDTVSRGPLGAKALMSEVMSPCIAFVLVAWPSRMAITMAAMLMTWSGEEGIVGLHSA